MSLFTNTYSTSVSTDVFAITKSDTQLWDGTTVRPMIRAVYFTTGGTFKYTSATNVVNTITVGDGFLLECAIKLVWSTGTSITTGMLGYV